METNSSHGSNTRITRREIRRVGTRLQRLLTLVFLCELSLSQIGCSQSDASGALQNVNASEEVEIAQQMQAVLDLTKTLIQKYENTETPKFDDEILVKRRLKELDVTEDAFSRLDPETWNLVRLKQPEFFIGEYDLSEWDDMKRKLSVFRYRLEAIQRRLEAHARDQ